MSLRGEPWVAVPPNLPTGLMFPPEETEAARRRVAIKRRIRRFLAEAGIKGVTVR